MIFPSDIAHEAIELTMLAGSTKDGRDDSWLNKPKGYHRMKAIRHLINADMVERGLIASDGEPHDNNALTRIAMLISQEKADVK
jgi:hypothetical protein